MWARYRGLVLVIIIARLGPIVFHATLLMAANEQTMTPERSWTPPLPEPRGSRSEPRPIQLKDLFDLPPFKGIKMVSKFEHQKIISTSN